MSECKRIFTDEELNNAVQLPKWRNEYLFGRLSDPDDPDYIGPAQKPELSKYEDDECIVPSIYTNPEEELKSLKEDGGYMK